MKRTISLVLALCLLLSCAALFAGCSGENSADYPVTIGDVTIDREPKNIVVLNDELADIISYIGYDVKMVGRSAECDQDFLYVVPVVGTASSPDVEAITSAETDLVIADNTLNANTKQTLENAGIKVLTLNAPYSEDDLHDLYVTLGTALGGNETGAEKGEQSYMDLFNMLKKLNTVSSNIVQTACYLYLDGSGQLCTFIKGTLEYKILSYNGCTNIFLNQQEPAVYAPELRVGSPKYIFYDSPAVLEQLRATPEYANIDALVNDHTMQIPIKQFQRHGSTAEQTVFEMLNYIEKILKATPDEAATEAVTEAAPAGTAAPAVTEAEAPEADVNIPEAEADAVTYEQ